MTTDSTPQTGVKTKFCPHCGANAAVSVNGVHVEAGEYTGSRYEQEGGGDLHVCLSCDGQFVDFSMDLSEEDLAVVAAAKQEAVTYYVRIRSDDDARDPRKEDEHLGHIVYTSSRYTLGDEYISDPLEHMLSLCDEAERDAIEEWEENYQPPAVNITDNELRHYVTQRDAEKVAKVHEAFAKKYVSLPVYAYIHSGVTISTGSFGDPWDSGQCGIIYAPRKNDWPGDDEDKIREVLEAEIREFDSYLQGHVWGYEVVKKIGDQEEVTDSCWGFYELSTDTPESMIQVFKEHMPDEITEEMLSKAWHDRE